MILKYLLWLYPDTIEGGITDPDDNGEGGTDGEGTEDWEDTGTEPEGGTAEEDPDESDMNQGEEPEEDSEEPEQDDGPEPEPGSGRRQSWETDSRFAAARRQAEQERDRAIGEMNARVSSLFEDLQLVNPYTNQPVRNLDDYNQYRSRFDDDQRLKFMSDHNMTRQQYDEMLNTLPEVRQARAEKQSIENMRQDLADQKAAAEVEKQIANISKMDRSIRTSKDLMEHPSYQKVYELVKRGYRVDDAFLVANKDQIGRNKMQAGKQQAITQTSGKNHMTTNGSSGQKILPDVPADILQSYKALDPEMTDAEIRKSYARYLKNTKR